MSNGGGVGEDDHMEGMEAVEVQSNKGLQQLIDAIEDPEIKDGLNKLLGMFRVSDDSSRKEATSGSSGGAQLRLPNHPEVLNEMNKDNVDVFELPQSFSNLLLLYSYVCDNYGQLIANDYDQRMKFSEIFDEHAITELRAFIQRNSKVFTESGTVDFAGLLYELFCLFVDTFYLYGQRAVRGMEPSKTTFNIRPNPEYYNEMMRFVSQMLVACSKQPPQQSYFLLLERWKIIEEGLKKDLKSKALDESCKLVGSTIIEIADSLHTPERMPEIEAWCDSEEELKLHDEIRDLIDTIGFQMGIRENLARELADVPGRFLKAKEDSQSGRVMREAIKLSHEKPEDIINNLRASKINWGARLRDYRSYVDSLRPLQRFRTRS